MIRTYFRFSSWFALLVWLTGLLVGCGSDGGSDNPLDGNGGGGQAVSLLSEIQGTILADADDSFDTLVQTQSYEDARQALVEQLIDTEGVASVGLLEDGITVWIVFDDGMSAIVNTVDTDTLSTVPGKSTNNAVKTSLVTDNTPIHAARTAMIEHNNAPASKQVLMLNISEPTIPNDGNITQLSNLLKLNGWTDDDIEVKTRTTPTDLSVQPSDIFQISDYGIIVVYAHGIYGTRPDVGTSNPYFYLQVCSGFSDTDPLIAQYREWALAGKLVPSADHGIYMRSDLLMDEMDILPLTHVFLNVNNGWHGRWAFYGRNCGAVYGWDDMVNTADAHSAVYRLMTLLTSGPPAQTVREAFLDASVDKTSTTIPGRTAELGVMPDVGVMFFPSWLNLTVETGSLPAGTTDIEVTVKTDGEIVHHDLLPVISGGSIESLFPGTGEVVLTAFEGATELAERSRSVTLNPGRNELLFDYSSVMANANLYVHHYDPGREGIPYGVTFYTYYIWDRNTDGDSYHITYHSSGQSWATSVVSHPELGAPYDNTKHCFGPDEVTAIFGSNIFGVGSGQVVFYARGSNTEFSEQNADERLQWVDEHTEVMLDDIADQYYKVFYD